MKILVGIALTLAFLIVAIGDVMAWSVARPVLSDAATLVPVFGVRQRHANYCPTADTSTGDFNCHPSKAPRR
jgi:hypothetical protein